MVKKLFLILMVIAPFVANAQFGKGSWITHSRYAIASAKNVIDAGDNVYSLVNNSLFCFNKTTKEQKVLSKVNGNLNDVIIDNIYYNHDKQYLVVAYDNSNIDVITGKGELINIPDIKGIVITRPKTLNDVVFAAGKMYVATGFGYVVIDDADFRIVESKNLKMNVNSAVELAGRTVLSADNKLYYAVKPEKLGDFKAVALTSGSIYPINDKSFFLTQKEALLRCELNFDASGTATVTSSRVEAAAPENVQKTKTGFLANFMAKKYYYTFNATGGDAKKIVTTTPAMFTSSPLGDGSLWSIDATGLKNSVEGVYYSSNSVSISNIPFWMSYNKNTHKLYLSNTTDNGLLPAYISNSYEMNIYDGTQWIKANPTGTVGTQGWYYPVFAPDDMTGTYYISSRLNGVFKVTDGKVVQIFDKKNFPFVERKAAIQFDSKGNLWAVHSSLSNNVPVKVLPKEKLSKSNVAISDWTLFPVKHVTDLNSFKYSIFDISKLSDVKAFCCGDYKAPLIFWKNGEDVTSQSGFTQKSYNSLLCDDGSLFSWVYNYVLLATEKDNMVFGGKEGLVWFDASKAFDEDFVAHKVRALDGINVTTVTVDALKRKWVGTNGSGIYLFNEDFSKELKHFTADNSLLATNVIYQLCFNPDNNSIFVVTPTAIQQYFDGTPSSPDYNHVYAYPNPVRPDFTGLITITGLMDNSKLVIKNDAGWVVKQLTSNGGMATWDGCDEKGERLPTGNYNVYASQDGNMPQLPCTTVMIIK